MGSTREKGKIPHGEWPKILARYNGGETIASIGRAYNCTAPAIRYIIKRRGALKGEAIGRRRAAAANSARASVLPSADSSMVLPLPVGRTGSGRDQILGEDLRQRVSGDVASFLVALDQAVMEGSTRSIALLQEATDQLMRSTARTRLELERMLSASKGTRAGKAAREKAPSRADA